MPVNRRRPEDEVDAEIRFHIQSRIEELLVVGLSEPEARTRAEREFGDLRRARELLTRETRRTRRRRRMRGTWDRWLQDFGSAVRKMRQHSGFTAVALLTLTLTIGANTIVLGVGDAVLFRPLPYDHVEQLYSLGMSGPTDETRYRWVRYAYLDALRAPTSLGRVGTADPGPPLVRDAPNGPESVRTAEVSADYFDILGVLPARGRLFQREDGARTDPVAVVSYGAWMRRFGGDEALVGETVRFRTRTLEIVGVLPPNFFFTSPSLGNPEVIVVSAGRRPAVEGGTFDPIVRLPPQTSVEAVQAELDRRSSSLLGADGFDSGTQPTLTPVREVLYDTGAPIVRLLLTASALVLLLGCLNLSHLMHVRNAWLGKEIGIRAALGATRGRIARPMVLEATLLATTSAGLAFISSHLVFDRVLPLVPPVAVGAGPVGIDLRIAVLTLLLGTVAALAFSLGPAWNAARGAGHFRLHESHARPRRGLFAKIRRPWIAVQVSMTVVLVFGAVVTGRALLSLVSVPLGFEPDGVAIVEVGPGAGISGWEAQQFYLEAAARLGTRGDVGQVGSGSTVPLASPSAWAAVTAPGSTETVAEWAHVLPGYFEAVGAELREGRFLTRDDALGPPSVAIVTESAARRLGIDGSALGYRIRDERGDPMTVVGVVADLRMLASGTGPPTVFTLPGDRTRRLSLLVRMESIDAGSLDELRSELARFAPLQVVRATWWSDSIRGLTAFRNPRFQTVVLGAFSALALALTAIGVFGVVAATVASRTREFGIRIALGSTGARVVRGVVRQYLGTVLAGLVVGLLATRVLGRLAERQLFEVETNDPTTLALAAGTVLLATLVASYLPARRASRVDPVVAQRAE